MSQLMCKECGQPMRSDGITRRTLVGYSSEPGHSHDDNCSKRDYTCGNGHVRTISIRRTCPACDWKGQKTCWCCDGEKVDFWPNETQDALVEIEPS